MSNDLELANAVAEQTAARVRSAWQEDLEAFRVKWLEDLSRLRDDLTVRLLPPDDAGAECALGEGRVLIVDDNRDVLEAIRRILAAPGLVTYSAISGQEASDILDRVDIDVVVTDLAMPKNGYTLLRHVREHHTDVEVIVTSGYDVDQANEAKGLGAFGFISKPFHVTQMLWMVEKAVELRRLKRSRSRG